MPKLNLKDYFDRVVVINLRRRPDRLASFRLDKLSDCTPERKPANGPIRRYIGAVSRWIAAGHPKRSDEEVNHIYDEICSACDAFNKDGACALCKCRVSKSKNSLVNKIRMATEHCPTGKW